MKITDELVEVSAKSLALNLQLVGLTPSESLCRILARLALEAAEPMMREQMLLELEEQQMTQAAANRGR
jgi:hypothetical protein